MAAKKRKASKGEDDSRSDENDPKKKLLLRGRECYKLAAEADDTNRKEALADIRFVNVPGEQWDANMKKRRGKRPCYEFNKLRINGKRVINEIRANRPQGKVRATEGGDKKGADLREGLCRNIWAQSDGDTIVDNAAEYQVDGGMACWRVTTEYADDDVFDQDIRLEGFKNPFCVHVDPNCKDPLKRDAEYWLVEDRVANSAYEERWPKAEKIEFDVVGDDAHENWQDEQTTRVCEYWYKEPYDKPIWQVKTPTGVVVVDSESDEAPGVQAKIQSGEYQLLRERSVRCHKIMMCILSGDSILEGPVEWAGSMFPFVMVYGEHKVIDGKFRWWGLHRFAKDSQQSYNVSRTSIDETIAQAPKAKFWATPTMAKGNVEQWATAHDENLPALIANPDPLFPGRFPERMPGADVPVALLQQATVAAQDIRDVTGLHEASFGEESSEKSGVALARKQNQAQIVTYNFPDNMAKGIKRTWEILLDLIPEIYDAERELRVLGSDGAEDYVTVNELVPGVGPDGQPTTVRVNDLSAGKYDVTITVGPNFSTLRQEAAEAYGEMAKYDVALMPTAGDLVYKSLDLPYAEEIAKRRAAMLPPPIQKMLTDGKELPPEVMAAQAQVEQGMAMVQQQGQLLQQAAGEVQQEKAQADTAKAGVEKTIANLKTEEARYDAKVAKANEQLTKRESDLALREIRLEVKEQLLNGQQEQADTVTKDVQSASKVAGELDAMVAKITEAMAQAIEQIRSETRMTIAMPKRSRLKAFRAERDKTGALVGIPEYDGDSDEPRVARVVMKDGVGTPVYEDQMQGMSPMMQ